MSLRTFNTFLLGTRLVVQMPLVATTAAANGLHLGYLTEVQLSRRSIRVERWTTYCTVGPSGEPRRVLRGQPFTRDELAFFFHLISDEMRSHEQTETVWRPRGAATSINAIHNPQFATKYDTAPFNWGDLQAFRTPAIQSRVGQPLMDWLAESDTFGRLISGPGWLPTTVEELKERQVQYDRDTTANG